MAHAKSVVTVTRPDGMALIDVRAGRRVSLDTFGSRVWTQLAREPTLAALIITLRDDSTSAERLAEDVVRLLSAWYRMGMIEWR